MSPSHLQELMAELQTEYFSSFIEKFQRIEELHKNNDWQGLELEFHKLKGTGTTYGAPEVTAACAQLERLFREQKKHHFNSLVPMALTLLQKIHDKYVSNQPFDLEHDPDYVTICRL